MANELIIPLGLTDDNWLIKNPYPNLSRLILGGTGAAKTTSVLMPTAQALFGHPDTSVLINDPKDGECYTQLKGVAQKVGRPFGCIDDFGMYGWDNPYRISLNPYGSVLSAFKHSPEAVTFAIEDATHAHIPEVQDGKRNFYFREMPREELHLGIQILGELSSDYLIPGSLYNLMSDPDIWRISRERAVDEGSPSLKARAATSLEMQESNPEEYARHFRTAISSLKPYETGSALNRAGSLGTLTHEELCRDGWIVCFVLPQVHAKRVGSHCALHQQSFLAAQFSGRGGRLRNIIDEMTNSPQRKAVEAVTIQRSYKTATDYIAQSFVDIEKSYGKEEAAILSDNCPVHQYLSFNQQDAERVSKLMGEEIALQQSASVNPEKLEISRSISMSKQPVMAAHQLLALPKTHQVVFLRGYGWMVCKKLFQNQIAPSCYWLEKNPFECSILPADPVIELPVAYCMEDVA